MFQLFSKFFILFLFIAHFGPSADAESTPTSSKSNGQETKITWYGHAAFEIVTPQGAVLMIDPWLNNPSNPTVQKKRDPIRNVKKLDYILITHGHFDHVGDAVALAKKTRAKLVSNFELGANLVRVHHFPENQASLETIINIGGEITIANGEVKVAMTPAIHSSGMDDSDPNRPIIYGGTPGGFIIQIKNGPTIYHSGDTAYFKDLELIGENYRPDIALINIGGHFGMSPEMAAKASKAVRAKWVIPQHYKTFPILTQDAGAFTKQLKQFHIQSKIMEPGSTVTFDNKKLRD